MSFETPVPPYTSADPYATFVGASCFDFLLIELVPLANRMAVELAAREEEWTRGVSIGNVVKRQSASSTGPREANAASTGGLVDEDETKEAVYHRLESLGYRVGLGVVERLVVNVFFQCLFLYKQFVTIGRCFWVLKP
jgi:trafficking protein particle complex subunit 6